MTSEPLRPGVPGKRAGDARVAVKAARFEEALAAGDPALAERLADECLGDGLDPSVLYTHVVAPAMQAIGERWQRGELTVADEHLATAISHNVLARVFPHLLRPAGRDRERVMLAATHGEHHILGLRMAADILEGAGFQVIYLGADVPLGSLLDACRKHRPAVLGLTVTMPLNVPTLLAELVAVAALAEPPLLLVGGRALAPAVEAGLRVPVVTHADQVVRVVEELVGRGGANPPLDAALLARLPRGEAAPAGESEIGTVPDHFSETVLAAADTARVAARRATAMEQLALRDPLTSLWNRRAFDDRLARLVEEDGQASLLMVDVDHFKAVNDALGHDAGDRTLCAVAAAILDSTRPRDFPARYGGDEFIVLLPDTSATAAAAVGERIRSAVDGRTADVPVTVSIGVSGFAGDKRLATMAVDRALYEAKQTGRNRIAVEGS